MEGVVGVLRGRGAVVLVCLVVLRGGRGEKDVWSMEFGVWSDGYRWRSDDAWSDFGPRGFTILDGRSAYT